VSNFSLIALIGEDVGAANVERLRAEFTDVDFRAAWEPGDLLAAAPAADIIFSKRLPADVIRAAARVRWVQAGIAGVEGWLAAGLASRENVVLTNARGAHGTPMSEVLLAMMLAFATGLRTLVASQSSREPIRAQVVATKFELEGQTLCVLGLGDIGGALARRGRALGMRVIGVRRGADRSPDVDELFPTDRRIEAISRADHVALCLPLTAETRGIVGERELRAMRPTAYVYNVGRGDSIEPNALLRALAEGWIAGAGLDVTTPEPLPANSPLWDTPNVILGQHTSGSSPRNYDRITDIFADNLRRYLAGEPLANIVDRQRGY
jgi:D-2-hydroxyacid dehydrogenase (NADP+)